MGVSRRLRFPSVELSARMGYLESRHTSLPPNSVVDYKYLPEFSRRHSSPPLPPESSIDNWCINPISGLQLAPVHRRLFRLSVGSRGAGGPAQIKIGPHRKHHRDAIQFGQNADSFFG